MSFKAEQPAPYELANVNVPVPDKTTARNGGFEARGKKMRIVFREGRDLNIFKLASFNVDGQWWRITDEAGNFYVVDPAKVNYTETK